MIDWWLIEKILRDDLTDMEKQLLNGWLNESLSHRQLYEKIKDSEHLMSEIPEPAAWRMMFERKLKRLEFRHKRRLLVRWGSIAALFMIALASGYWWNIRPTVPSVVQTPTILHAPDHTKVKLFTAHGKVMNLSDDEKNDTLIIDGMRLVKQSGGLSYQKVSAAEMAVEPINNQIVVPRGSEFHLTLNDGTKVWLNSDSRLTYPVVFVGENRKVELQGEAYFEVTKDSLHPFVVMAGGTEVTVLGTEFNVNAYDASRLIRTTLVSGKVKVCDRTTREKALLRPNQQAEWHPDRPMEVKEVDVSDYVSWITGKYYFDGSTLEEISEQIRRWYDLEFFFTSEELKHSAFAGVIDREYSANEIFTIIEKTTRVKFDLKERTVIVRKR